MRTRSDVREERQVPTVELRLPGDKSIAHRAMILAALADGSSTLSNVPESADVRATMDALRVLGVDLGTPSPGEVVVRGPTEWRTPAAAVDCGNSGTTARLLTGLLVGLGRGAEITGDASLRRRPMDRVVYPLQSMGGRIRYLESPD
jgi:3-phosphoshikimate 1-carboxyvinyltransferase